MQQADRPTPVRDVTDGLAPPAVAPAAGSYDARPPAPDERRTFEAPAGTIVGRVDGDVVRVLGVRYAEAGRFEVPRPVPRAEGPVEAFTRAPASPQLPSPLLARLIEGAEEGMVDDEDCQRLSVTLPADATPDERLPVMVWIHGGSYVTGAGDLDVYDPVLLVREQRVVVVTVTYRLGVLGYSGGDGRTPANLGLLDQLAAVRWVHENVAAFGGDPDTVTLFGQSAGGDAVAHLMVAEGARGLFRRAIVQSAPLGISRGRAPLARAIARVVGEAPADASVEELLALQARVERTVARRWGLKGGMPFGVQYGRAPLPAEADVDVAWRDVAPDVDLLVGATTHETALFTEAVPALRRAVRLPVVGRGLHRLLVGGTTRLVYGADARAFARRHREAGGRAVRYESTWAPRGTGFGAAHVTELPLLLGTRRSWAHTRLLGSEDWGDVERRGRRVRAIWAEFARTGTVRADSAAGADDTIRLHPHG